MAAFFFVPNGAGWKTGQNLAAQDPGYLRATSACLNDIILMQIVNVFLCRSSTRSIFSTGLLGNAFIVLGVISEIAALLLINYTPWGDPLLGTAPIGAVLWAFIAPFRAGMFASEELRTSRARKRLSTPASQGGVAWTG